MHTGLERIGEKSKLLVYNAIVPCNPKCQKLWAMRVEKLEDGRFAGTWLEKYYEGYGKRATVYYDLSPILAGDLLRVSGGSWKNYYPQVVRVISISESEMEYEPLTDREAKNLLVKEKNSRVDAIVAAYNLLNDEEKREFDEFYPGNGA